MRFAHHIAEDVATAARSAQDIIQEALHKAHAVQAELNAFATICDDEALARARGIDGAVARGDTVGPLAGVPIVIKDNICTQGIRTTAGSKILKDFVPPYGATVVERLERAGAIVIAKANLDEFGMGSTNEHSMFGAAKNPWNKDHVPGGSSGGSAVAVATGVVPLALGTDTGGSVRQPAAFNGILGFKPTYGRLSRYGVIAYGSSLDQVGVLARSSRDAAIAMDVMTGIDGKDSTSLESPANFAAQSAQASLQGVRIGLINELLGEGNSPEILAAVERSKAQLEELGAELVDCSLPHSKYGIASYYLIAPAEASSNLARYDGMIYSTRGAENAMGQAEAMMRSRGQGFGPEVRRRILIGSYALSAGYYDAYYGKALKVRRLIAEDFAKAFEQVDLLLAPMTPTTAPKIGELNNDPLKMYLSDSNTVLANLVGLAALSVPAGCSSQGLPCGVQFLAPPMQDEALFRLSMALEAALGDDFAPLAEGY